MLFQFLEEEFLRYIQCWQEAIENREGFTRAKKAAVFLTPQTYAGLLITGEYFV